VATVHQDINNENHNQLTLEFLHSISSQPNSNVTEHSLVSPGPRRVPGCRMIHSDPYPRSQSCLALAGARVPTHGFVLFCGWFFIDKGKTDSA
jgi:hypothetical protein